MKECGLPIGRRGLTLVEVLIAMVILAVAILPAVLAFRQSLAVVNESTIAAAAASIAREKVEDLKGLGFDQLYSQPREPRDLKAGDGFFEVAVTVETLRPDDAAHSGLKKAEVAVYRAGGSERLAIATTCVIPMGI